MAAQRAVLETLRQEIRRLERRPPGRFACVATGVAEVDAALPGGFPRGALCDISGEPASGKTWLALRALARAMGDRGYGAWLDGRGELYPPAAQALGVALERLVVVRPGAASDGVDALWAAEVLLASGAFEGVVIDLPRALPGRASGGARLEAMLRRLAGAAEKGGALAIWLSSPGGVRPPTPVRLEVLPDAGGAPRVRRTFGAVPTLQGELLGRCETPHAA